MELLRVKRLGKVIQPYNQRAKLASWRPRPNLAKALSLFLYVVKYVTVVPLLYDSKASFKPYSITINTLCVKTFIFPTRKIRKIRSHWPMYPYISVPFKCFSVFGTVLLKDYKSQNNLWNKRPQSGKGKGCKLQASSHAIILDTGNNYWAWSTHFQRGTKTIH